MRGEDDHVIMIRVKPNSQIWAYFRANSWCRRITLPDFSLRLCNTVHHTFCRMILLHCCRPFDTPADLGLVDGDVIEAFHPQIGGCISAPSLHSLDSIKARPGETTCFHRDACFLTTRSVSSTSTYSRARMARCDWWWSYYVGTSDSVLFQSRHGFVCY